MDRSVVIKEAVLKKLDSVVSFDTPEAARDLVADAINTYIHLGGLSAKGAEFFARAKEGTDYVPLRFQFQNETKTSEGEE